MPERITPPARANNVGKRSPKSALSVNSGLAPLVSRDFRELDWASEVADRVASCRRARRPGPSE